jgi:hypothetical protein
MVTKTRIFCPHCHKKLEKNTISLRQGSATTAALAKLAQGKLLSDVLMDGPHYSKTKSDAIYKLLEKGLISRKKQFVYSIKKSGIEAIKNVLKKANLSDSPIELV